jgi:hypothetical protein
MARGARMTASLIGDEQEPLLQAEGALAEPETLIEIAAANRFEPAFGPAGGYPGLRATLPDEYVAAVVNALARPIAEAFSLGPVRPIRAQGAFSLVTLPPASLAAPQRAPHVDSVDPMQFAILHYLCDGAMGGTSFYRHRATGFETLSDDRLSAYQASRGREGLAPGYVDDGGPWFQRTAQVNASRNRLVAYRSCVLHCFAPIRDGDGSPPMYS